MIENEDESPALTRLIERVRSARDCGTPLRIRGSGTKDFYGELPQGELLDTTELSGISSYAPTELVVTARCGTPLAELEAALETGSLLELVARFEERRFSTRDVLALVVAGLRGGGWQGSAADLLRIEIGGGPVEAARAAAELLARAFALPEEP